MPEQLRRTIRAMPLDGSPAVELWEGTAQIDRHDAENSGVGWPGDDQTIEVLSIDGTPALPDEVARAWVRVRSVDGRKTIETTRFVTTLAHAIFASLDDDESPRDEHFVQIGERWVCCWLETWRERAWRLEQILVEAGLHGPPAPPTVREVGPSDDNARFNISGDAS